MRKITIGSRPMQKAARLNRALYLLFDWGGAEIEIFW